MPPYLIILLRYIHILCKEVCIFLLYPAQKKICSSNYVLLFSVLSKNFPMSEQRPWFPIIIMFLYWLNSLLWSWKSWLHTTRLKEVCRGIHWRQNGSAMVQWSVSLYFAVAHWKRSDPNKTAKIRYSSERMNMVYVSQLCQKTMETNASFCE